MTMRDAIPWQKQVQRVQLEKDVEAFLAAGNSITVVRMGLTRDTADKASKDHGKTKLVG